MLINKFNASDVCSQEMIKNDLRITRYLLKSKTVIIKQYESNSQTKRCDCYILCFEQLVLFIEEISLASLLNELLSINSNLSFLFLTKSDDIINNKEKIKFTEIINFISAFQFDKIPINIVILLFSNFIQCVAAYLIQKSYEKQNINRINRIKSNQSQEDMLSEINKKDYIYLRSVGCGSSFLANLYFHIKKEIIFVIKSKFKPSVEYEKLYYRVCKNCFKLNHSFIPKFYCKNNKTMEIAMEFIFGKKLSEIKMDEYTKGEILNIVLQIILSVQYMHNNHFIIRDINPENIIIDQNKNAIIIDFDRMISYEETNQHTNDFGDSTAPEVNLGILSYKNDVYSIGYIMKYIIREKVKQISDYSEIMKIYEKCLLENYEDRPSISEIFEMLIEIIQSSHFQIKDKLKTEKISENFSCNINEYIYYNTLAANQNDPVAQFNLGLIYYENKYNKQNIKKSFDYFKLAADQKYPNALFYIGLMNDKGEYVQQDFQKSIEYYLLAAKLNCVEAQCNLGSNYLEGKHVLRDINKSIHYYLLAADQNCTKAQLNLGDIYLDGKYVSRNIQKSIHYFELAADKDCSKAQYKLGKIFLEDKYIKLDVNKAIKYLEQASNNNDPNAICMLGEIYLKGEYVEKNIKISILYCSEAAKQNNDYANFLLGFIYQYEEQNIEKSM